MVIEISDQLIQRSGLSEKDILLAIAIDLFTREKITLASAAKLAGLHQIQFQKELGERQIPIHYDVKDFENDLETLTELSI